MKKNKIRFLLFVLVSILLFPKVVFAEDSNTLVGNDMTSPGAKISYELKVSSAAPFKKYEAELVHFFPPINNCEVILYFIFVINLDIS